MSNRCSRVRFGYVVAMLAIAVQACGATQESIATRTTASGAATEVSPPPPPFPNPVQATAVRSATASISPTPSAERVTVSAAKGNLFIRRGPDLAFNPLSLLRDGQSAQALARDVLANWVQIPFPGQPERTGWISIQSRYAVVSGDVIALPEIEPTDWPAMASLRNCTYHQMLVDPGGIVLPSVDNFPENDVRLNPGTYVVRDADSDADAKNSCPTPRSDKPQPWACYAVILTVDVREGAAIIIGTEGEKKNCPVPFEDSTPRCAKRPGHRMVEACPTPP